jgi:hypothetical protein
MAALAARKAEKLLKELQHRPENKTCADCSGTGALGPTYVVSNFGTFVCTNCATAQCALPPCYIAPYVSRVRSRSLNHRVKGTSMSTFSLDELSKLQAQGNEARALRTC